MDRATVDHDGRTTEYWVAGADTADRVVLYVHGSGCRHDVWTEQMDREGVRSVAVNLSGHGGSDDVDTDPGMDTIHAYARDVQAVARAIDADVVVGHSLGGAVVQTLLLDHEYEPDAAVLAGTGAKLGLDQSIDGVLQGDIDPLLAFMVEHDILFTDGDHPHVETTTDIMAAVGMAMLRRDLRSCNEFDVRGRLEAVDVPALCLVGDSDKLTPPTFSEFLADTIAGGVYAEVPDAGHMAMLENHTAFDEEMDAFLAGHL